MKVVRRRDVEKIASNLGFHGHFEAMSWTQLMQFMAYNFQHNLGEKQ